MKMYKFKKTSYIIKIQLKAVYSVKLQQVVAMAIIYDDAYADMLHTHIVYIVNTTGCIHEKITNHIVTFSNVVKET
jgi:hypothetical protein